MGGGGGQAINPLTTRVRCRVDACEVNVSVLTWAIMLSFLLLALFTI